MKTPHRSIGNSGIMICPIGLGSMSLSIQGRPDYQTAISVIHAALDNGIELIDTADVYCLDHRDIGYCERLIADALKTWKNSKHIVVATKGGLERPNGAWTVNSTPGHLKIACEASLKALNVDCIELYQLHAPDDKVPYAESIGMLRELQNAGKIRHIGISNVTLAHIQEAQKIVNVVSVQNRCNPFDLRAFRTGIIDYCEKENITFFPWSPVGGSPEKYLTASHPLLLEIGAIHNATPFQVVLAWLLASSKVMLPIPSASKAQNARGSAEAVDIRLKDADISKLNKAFGLEKIKAK